MPICVFDTRPQERLNDTELDALIFKVGDEWTVREHRFTQGRFRKKVVFHYSLLKALGGRESQLINFYIPGSENSINTAVPAGYIVAYLYGIIAGKDGMRRRLHIKPVSMVESVRRAKEALEFCRLADNDFSEGEGIDEEVSEAE